jgi:hypothetical protein
MPASIIPITTVVKSDFIDGASRYNSSPLIYWGDLNQKTFKIYKRKAYVSSPDDKFGVITGRTQYRPDLISYVAYGDSRYWWKIMEANNIFDVMDLKAGLNILIPGLSNN